MLFTKLTLCSQIRNIVLKVAMNLVFIYLGEECLVITYSASCATMCLVDVISGPEEKFHFDGIFSGSKQTGTFPIASSLTE